MAGKGREDLIKLLEPVVGALGYELVLLQYLKEGGRWVLRLFIDQPGGVGLEDCERVSRAVEEVLDRDDPIPYAFVLEVSSPGLERPLVRPGDYLRFSGHRVMLKCFQPLDGRRVFRGVLVGLVEDQAVLRLAEGQEVKIPLGRVSRAHLLTEDG